MKKIYLLLTTALFFVGNSFGQIVVAGSVGADGTYPSLTQTAGAFAAINAAGSQAGNNITISINGDVLTEDGTAPLLNNGWTSLTISPAGTHVISGSFNGSLIRLDGANNIAINGIKSGINFLTISNTSAGTLASTLGFINDASNNTISNTVFLGSTASTTSGVIYFGAGVATGNDNNTITNCSIAEALVTYPANAIYSAGTSAVIDNSGNTLSMLNISDYFSATTSSAGINLGAFNSGWTITTNSLYQAGARIYTTANTHYGITISSGSGYTISNNIIGGNNPAGTNTTIMAGVNTGSITGTFPVAFTIPGVTSNATRYVGINCAFTAAGAVSSIQNNTIGGFALLTSSNSNAGTGVICGIAVTAGNANIGTTTGNTIGSTTGQGSIYVAATTAGAVVSGIYCTSANSINVQNNNIGGIDVSGTSATTAAGFKGIDVSGIGTYTVTFNNIGNSTANNIRTGYLLSAGSLSNIATTPTTATGTSAVQGILNSSLGATLDITNNTFRGIQISGSATTFTGINNVASATASMNINNNNLGTAGLGLLNLAVTNTGLIICILNTAGSATCALSISTNNFQGVSYAGPSTASFQCINTGVTVLTETINGNNFNNLSVNTTSQTIGFLIASTNSTPTVSITNNYVTTKFVNTNPTGSVNYFAIANNGGVPTSGSATISGNNLSNISFKTTSSYGSIIYWSAGTGATCTHNITVSNNTITNNSNTGVGTTAQAASLYCVVVNLGSTNTISNNEVSFNSAVGGTVIGIFSASVSPNPLGSVTIRNNNVHDISTTSAVQTAAGTAQGIQLQGGPGTTNSNNVYKNKIYNISAYQGEAFGIYAAQATVGSTTNIYNNIIGKLSAASSVYYQGVAGIFSSATAANTINLYYNTINLEGSCLGQSYCVYTSSANPTINMRNNILINNITPAGGTGFPSVVYFRNGALSSTYSTASNNNIMYCGTPGALNLIYADGASATISNPQATLGAFQSFVGPTRENASKSENTPFVNSANGALATYLHINSNSTLAESGGNATGLTGTYDDDYDGQVRFGSVGYAGTGTAPDIGADEFQYVPTIDIGALALVTPAVSGCRTTTESVTVSIKNYGSSLLDLSINPVTVTVSATGPNTYSSSIIVSSGTLAALATTNIVLPATFDMTAFGIYTFNATATVAGDVDVTNDAMGATTRQSLILGGTYTVGALGTYATLTAAAAAYNNAGCFNNNVVFSLIDPTYSASETFPITINSNAAAGSYTLTIVPAASNTATITGSSTVAIIKLNGADNVIIDGSNNGTNSQNLSIINTNATSLGAQGIIWLASPSATDGATGNTIKNCILTGNASSTTLYTVASTGSVMNTFALTGNSNNTVQNNAMGKVQEGIYILGYSAGSDNNWTITQNTVGASANTIGFDGMFLYNMSNYTISNNTVSNVTLNAANPVTGINLSGTHSAGNIYANNINTIVNTGAGMPTYGIELEATSTASNIKIYNNFISNIRSVGSATAANNGFGIYAASGGGYNIYYNSISQGTNQTSATGTTAAINISSGITTAASIDLRDNIFSNTQTTGTRYAIYSTAANSVFSAMDYNDYYSSGTNLGFQSGILANLAAIQGAGGFGVANNAGAVNALPAFTSVTDLHLTAANNCGLDGYGTPIAGMTTDLDPQTRDITAPDMGADEFNATYSTTLAAPSFNSTVSVTKIVSPSGTTYTTTACELIAKVLPAGASPVAGAVKVAVTRDASSTNLFFNAEPYLTRHYDIDPVNNASTATATITMYYTDQEFIDYNTNNPLWPKFPTVATGGNADPNVTNIRVTQYHGTPSTTPSSPGNYSMTPGLGVVVTPVTVNYNGTSWEVSVPVTGFSGFYVYTAYDIAPLPITLNYLRGTKQGATHNLNWSITCNTTPTAMLELERSADGTSFKTINTINATALRCQQPFDYADVAPLTGINYYRLKMTDANGKVSYSNIVTLINATKGLDVLNIAPNPVTGASFKLNVSSAKATQMQVVITDMMGRVVSKQTVSLIAGFNSLEMNVRNLPSGAYNVYGATGDEQTKVLRMVKN